MYNNILIPMDPDFSDQFGHLVELARRVLAEGGTISTLYVNQNYIHHRLAANLSNRPTEIEQEVLDQVIARFESCVEPELRGRVYSQRGVAHDQILRIARRIRADLIIMSPNKRPWLDCFLGSTTRRVVAEARCSVFVER